MPPAVVLVPGLDGTGLLFYRQIPLLEQRFHVITHRLPDEARSLTELVADLHARLDGRLEPGEAVTLVGESFGGAVSLSYALAHPERVGRLVVVNSFPFFSPQARLRLGSGLLRLTPWGMMRLVRRLTAWRLHSGHTGRDEIRRFLLLMRATTRAGYLSRLHMLRDYDVRHRLHELSMPVLYVAADQDHLVPSEAQARLMAALTPNATVQVLAGHGHICLIAPDLDLAALLTEWEAAGGPTTARSRAATPPSRALPATSP
jgi:pimeloyl-ACP methyl ester carboxylesterase